MLLAISSALTSTFPSNTEIFPSDTNCVQIAPSVLHLNPSWSPSIDLMGLWIRLQNNEGTNPLKSLFMSRLFSLIKGSPEALPPAFSCAEFAPPLKSRFIPAPWNLTDETGICLFFGPVDSFAAVHIPLSSWSCSVKGFLPVAIVAITEILECLRRIAERKNLYAPALPSKEEKIIRGCFCLILDMCKVQAERSLWIYLDFSFHLDGLVSSLAKTSPVHH